MSSEDPPSDDNSEENNDRTEQDHPDPEPSSSNETSTDTNPGEDDDDDNSEGSGYTPFRHPLAGMYQDIQETVQATNRAMIGQMDVKGFREALIESGAISTLDMLSDPEFQKQLAHPIDPESMKEIQETAARIHQLSDFPRIHADSEIISTLQKLNDPAILEAYETAATLERLQQPPTEEQDDKATQDHGTDLEQDASEPEIAAEPLEDSVQGSTFLYYTAKNLLPFSDQLPEDATHYLEKIPNTGEVEKQKEYFDQAVSEVGDQGKALFSTAIWTTVGYILRFHYGPAVVASSQDASVDEAEDGEEQ